MDPIHQQAKHRRGSSPPQEPASEPNERIDHRWVEQERKDPLTTLPISAETDPEAGVVT